MCKKSVSKKSVRLEWLCCNTTGQAEDIPNLKVVEAHPGESPIDVFLADLKRELLASGWTEEASTIVDIIDNGVE